MTLEASLNALAPPVFDGINYQVWAIRMEAYLDASDLWEAVSEEYEVPLLFDNPTMAQIKLHNERRQRKSKAKASLFVVVSSTIFTRIMTLKTTNGIWNFLKKEYEGNERVKGMQVLNLIREFEMQRMKELETIKDYSNRLLSIVNKAQEQRRLMRQEGYVEGAFQAISQHKKEMQSNNNSSNNTQKFPPCPYYKKSNHPQKRFWWRPDVKCHKCGQLGHVERICKSQQYSPKTWLIDSGCTNRMTYDQGLFKELDKTVTSKVRIGNGAYLAVKGKGTLEIEGHTGQSLHIVDAQGREVFIVQMKGKSFALDLMQEEQAAIHKEKSNTMLWHRRLGHFHHTALLFMKKNDLGEGLPELEAWRATQKLQLVHTDLGGPQRTLSLNGTWAENQSKCKMQVIRSDNGTEYTSEKFNKFSEDAGIEHQLTTPYTPQHNGVVERKNRTLMEMTRGTRSLSDIYQRCNVTIIEPTGYEEAAADKKWMDAMKEELTMIEKNQTWELVDKLTHKRAIGVKWTFALVARLDTIRMLLALAAKKEWNIHQMDVKSAFLNGYLEEEIFVEQLEGFIIQGMEEKVYLLKKALYGLKQAPRAWKVCDETLVVSLYVDDLLVIGSSMEQINNFKKEMKDVFEMTDLGRMTFFLGMEMEECNPSATPVNQSEKFCKEDGSTKADKRLYRTIIGCLMYLTTTRPDIMNAVQKEGEIQLVYCKTESQNADILTKPLPKARYEFLRQRLGVCSSRDKEEC
ncbi:Retrovirus-related Pol polyprotein from transposon RE1 [Vitis vinifera]|uniref:Retrovirus-related Pol polyprotein from transposon RE1 n=1 Tax=Vitis vinifera TaxID=29760 RepID=A0A438EDA9_VITVI|nr:Retrovirus-related Pol polyprotein from transposon RE1 [Vitis vinifera]